MRDDNPVILPDDPIQALSGWSIAKPSKVTMPHQTVTESPVPRPTPPFNQASEIEPTTSTVVKETKTPSSAVVQCERLSKRYGDFQALVDCTLSVYQRDVFGLLGPNGAGKTTLIRSLLGFLRCQSGTASVCGLNPATESVEIRRQVAYLPGDARLPKHLSGAGVLKFFADAHPLGDLKRSHAVADALDLNLRRLVGMMSTGMRQKLALAVVLAPQTPLLILDEPTANLDPSVRATVLEYVNEAHRAGRTVILSSHVLSEIEDTCNRVAFMRDGSVALELEMSELFQRHRIRAVVSARTPLSELVRQVPDRLRDSVTLSADQEDADERPRSIRIDTAGDLAPMLEWISTLGLERMRIEPLGLRAVYDSVHHGAELDLTPGGNGENDKGDAA